MLLFLTLIPTLLWNEGPDTAPRLAKAGIHQIAVTANAAAWSSTNVKAAAVDEATLQRLDPPGVDYQLSRASATALPWVNSNLWRMLRGHDRSYLYEVKGPAVALAVAEAYAANVPAYIKLAAKEDLTEFANAIRFASELDTEAMPRRANFTLVDDGSNEIEEVMNLLSRRNLLYTVAGKPAGQRNGLTVQIGKGEFTNDIASDPYKFAAVVRSKISDAKRLVRLYGTETTLAQLYGGEKRARLHLIQYGRNSIQGVRVRVLGKYPRVMLASAGQRVSQAEDVVVDAASTEFTIPELRNYAVIDLDSGAPGVLTSVVSNAEFELTANPEAPQWKSAPKVTIQHNAFGGPLPIAATEVRSRWTKDSLYLLYSAPFDKLNLHPNPVTDRDTPNLWDWDVAEAFIGADDRHIAQYREYQVSPQGEWVDLAIDVSDPRGQEGMRWNSGYAVKARIDAERKIWYGEMRIPLTSIAAKPFKTGDHLRLGLFRCHGVPPDRTFAAWQPAFRRSFHTPEAFGTLLMVDVTNERATR